MNPSRGQPASELLARLDTTNLAAILRENADEPHAESIALQIKASAEPARTTTALAASVRAALSAMRIPAQEIELSVRRVFQAVRIAVNEELSALDMFLRQLPSCLLPGGRVAILTFHSGEDRRVKKAFKEGLRAGWYGQIAGDILRPSAEEVQSNPRAASAKLRWAERAR